MKKLVLSMLLSAAAIWSVPAVAQNAVDSQRIALIDSIYDSSRGVKITNPTNGQPVYFKELSITIGKRAVWECIQWGYAVTPWWVFFNRRAYSINEAKNCAANVLTPIYGARRQAYEAKRLELLLSTLPVGNIPNLIPPMPAGFVPHSLKVAEYNSITAIIDADYDAVGCWGCWGQLNINIPTPRGTSIDDAPLIN
jgi:hypothetical protein